MASPLQISYHIPRSLPLFSTNSFSTLILSRRKREPIYQGAVLLKPAGAAADSASAPAPAPAEPAKNKPAASPPKRPVYSMKKGQIVRVDKEKYLNSINYLSVDHPPYYKGLDYIYEDRGEVLDIRIFETGECALREHGTIPFRPLTGTVAWVGIPTPPAWLPTDMLIKSEKLDYERI